MTFASLLSTVDLQKIFVSLLERSKSVETNKRIKQLFFSDRFPVDGTLLAQPFINPSSGHHI
jgi:hypothetical protein